MRILVIEDDPLTAGALTAVLANQTYAVEVAADGQTGLDLIETYDYDLVLLDVMLPKMDGISLCRRLRSHNYQMPILLLTGRDSGHDKALGLDAGADDYVVKPFDEEELVARVRALLRRGSTVAMPILTWGSLQLDPTSCEVTYVDQRLSLTPKEYALLELFMRNSRRVFSCGAILEHLWSYEETPGEEAVRTHIKGLRQKLKAAGIPPDLIETVYGIGYRFKAAEKDPTASATTPPGKSTQQRSSSPSPPAPPSEVNLPSSNLHPVAKDAKQQTLTAIAAVWHRFKDRVSEQVGVLEQASTALLSQRLHEELRHHARQEAHTLAGSLGTFGFTEGSKLARQIETVFKSDQSPKAAEAKALNQWVMALRQEIEQEPAGGAIALPQPEPEAPPTTPLLLVIDPDRTAHTLAQEASNWGLRVAIAPTLSAARQSLRQTSPQAVLIDLSVAPQSDDGLGLLTELRQHIPPIPVLVYSQQDDFAHRLAVLRQGGEAFLQKSLPAAEILEAVNRVMQRITLGTPGKAMTALTPSQPMTTIMVVDDDPKILEILRSLLEPWGLQVTPLDDPRQFWEVLARATPDLLILDVEMPHADGVELCQMVRNDSHWAGLPVLFLTAHTDAATINQVFSAGGDDFITKPIVGPELVTRILNRLERIKLLRNMAELDPLTKVFNRPRSTQDLEAFLHSAQQHQQPLCFAVLDLDCLKQINDRYSHAMGDAVLRQLGNILRQTFDQQAIVARWGGEEFVIGMYGIEQKAAIERLSAALATLHQHEFTTPTRDQFRVTFSAGVAQFPQDGTDLRSLYRAADQAVQQAKIAGRDRIFAATSSSSTPSV